jgi:chromate transporter
MRLLECKDYRIALSITGIYGLIFLKETSTDINNLRVKTFKLPKMLVLLKR